MRGHRLLVRRHCFRVSLQGHQHTPLFCVRRSQCREVVKPFWVRAHELFQKHYAVFNRLERLGVVLMPAINLARVDQGIRQVVLDLD